MTRSRRLTVSLLVVFTFAAGQSGGAAGGGRDDPPQSPSTTPPSGTFLAALASPGSATFTPTDDTYSSSTNRSTVHGSLTYLRVDGDPIRRGYVRFAVSGLTEPITRVTLSVYARTSHATGFDLRKVTSNAWSERTLTYNNAPAASTTVAARSGALTAGAWKAIDVTSLVPGNGTFSFALTNSRSSSIDLGSKEGPGTAPKLVVETAPPPNRAPIAAADAAGVTEDGTLSLAAATLLANDSDPDGDALRIASVTPRVDTNGALDFDGQTVTYVPAANFAGTATFGYTIDDGNGGSASAAVTLAVAAVNDAPVCATAAYSTRQGEAVAAEGLCSDVDDAALTYSVATAPSYGTLTLTAAGASYLPALAATQGTARNDAFALTATDPAGATATAGVTVLIEPRAGDLTLPSRAAFYYPWFPEAWQQQGYEPFTRYTPTLTPPFYSSSDPAVVRAHVRALQYGGFDAAIASWWGQHAKFENERIPLLLNTTAEMGSQLKWSLYYEPEGRGNPTVETLRADLAYIRTNYAGHANYARVDGKPVLFVYSVDDTSCELTERWRDAAAGEWYIVLNVFPGFALCPVQPDAWHQYGPAQPVRSRLPHSYNISPGFWRPDEPTPRLARDLTRFDQNVRDMVASGARWQLVTSFNEWGEGTQVESAVEWQSPSGYGAYLDVLHAHPGGGG